MQGMAQEDIDIRFMGLALEEAEKALLLREVPIGAIVVKDGVVIGSGYNRRETDKDPTAHAEIIALRDAARTLGGWRLTNCDMYVTIEPCAMCAGALIQSRIRRVVFGAHDTKAGACGGAFDLPALTYHNHHPVIVSGVQQERCSELMGAFFKTLRQK